MAGGIATSQASEDPSDEALDLEELMQHWSEREKAVFCGEGRAHIPPVSAKNMDLRRRCGRSPSTCSSISSSSGDACEGPPLELEEERARAVQLLRLLAASHDADAELPSMLTLLDALLQIEEVQEPTWALQGLVTTPIFLAALLRLSLKSNRGPAAEEGNVSDVALCSKLGQVCEDVDESKPITQAELGILSALNGRAWMPSPAEWVSVVVARLSALATSEPLKEALSQVLPSALSWSGVLSERVAASARLPPRALAVGAVALGLIGTGLLAPEEMRPAGLQAEAWKESLLAKMGDGSGGAAAAATTAARRGDGGQPVSLSSWQLAEAACCGEATLRSVAFKVVAALQRSLCG